jgi:hypothetical protein
VLGTERYRSPTFFPPRSQKAPGTLGLTTIQFSCARAHQARRVELLRGLHDAKKLTGAITVESFLGSRPSAFSFPVSAPLFRLTADQFDWQTQSTPDEQEIS